MTLRKLGSTGLNIGPLGLGSVNFSWLTNEPDSFAILDAAFDRGINLLDTSDNYNAGQTEALIGRWFSEGGGRREKTVLATKCYSAPMEWGSADPVKRSGSWVGPNQKGLSAKHIREACEASLKRLKLERIDLYQLHTIDGDVPLADSVGTLVELQKQGKIRHIGLSNVNLRELAQARKLARIVSVQNRYSLGDRAHDAVVDQCAKDGLAFLPWYPLAAGALAKRGGKLAEIAKRHQATPIQIALAWLLRRAPVILPIPGTSSIAHFEENLAAAGIALTDAEMNALG